MTPSRRQFVAKISMLMAALAIPSFGWAIGKKKKKKKKKADGAADTKMGLIDTSKRESDPEAKTLWTIGYVANAKDYKKNENNKSWQAKANGGVEHNNQKCKDCVLAAADGKNWKCNVVPTAKFYVHADGWCQSWNPKG